MSEPGPATDDAVTNLARIEDLEAAYRAHAPELHRFAARRLHDEAAAADVVQEVFVRAWRHAERYDASVASLRVWLFTIARHLVVDHVRHDRARPSRVTDPSVLPDVIERAGRRDGPPVFSDELVTAWCLEDALGALSPEHRTAIVETAVRGRPYREVADELGVPVGTVRSRVFHGLRRLRTILHDMGVPL